MAALVVPLRSRRRARGLALQKLQHAVPAIGLIVAGTHALRSGARGLELGLALVEVFTSVLLIRAIVRSVREARAHGWRADHGAHGVDWTEIWAAGVLFAEAAERWHQTQHIARPVILTAFLTLGLGLFHHRLAARGARRRSLRVDDDGVHVGGRLFGAFHARWTEIADIAVSGRRAEIRTHTGRVRRVNLADLEDAEAVRAALDMARAHLTSLPPPPEPAVTAVKA